MDLRSLHAQLLAIQAQVAALLVQVEATVESTPPDAGCTHPSNKRQDLRVMGDPTDRWRCQECGHIEGG
jgi:hypothetical protein